MVGLLHFCQTVNTALTPLGAVVRQWHAIINNVSSGNSKLVHDVRPQDLLEVTIGGFDTCMRVHIFPWTEIVANIWRVGCGGNVEM
jgi:hypothetical protein